MKNHAGRRNLPINLEYFLEHSPTPRHVFGLYQPCSTIELAACHSSHKEHQHRASLVVEESLKTLHQLTPTQAKRALGSLNILTPFLSLLHVTFMIKKLKSSGSLQESLSFLFNLLMTSW